MSWWWNKVQASPSSDPVEQQPLTYPEPPLAANPKETARRTPPRTLSRDEQAYEELKSIFHQIDPERAETAAAAAKTSANAPSPDYSNSLYASTMSCSQCFDQAFYCSSIGGQLNNIYRYGALRSCSDLWAQWRFCMRTKGMSEDMERTKIREWNQQKAAKYKLGRSSEDVWEARKEHVENPFTTDVKG